MGKTWRRFRRIAREPLPDLKSVERLAVKAFMFFFGHLMTAENAATLGNLPGPVLFVFNHNNYFETLCVYVFLLFACRGKKPCFVVDWMFAHIPLVGWFVRRSRPVYVYSKRARWGWIRSKKREPEADTLSRCLEAAAEGRSLGIFPEGKANADPDALLRGREGAGYLILGSGLDVVPIGIDFKLRRERGRIPVLGRMILRIGPRLRYTGPRPAVRISSLPAAKKWRKRAAAIVDLVMRNLSLLSGKTYPFREPVGGKGMAVAYLLS